jgi:multiple sugar transport system substrate-binding protein
MKIKGLLILLLAVFLVSSGCAKSGNSGKTKIRVTVWVEQDELDALMKLAEDYNKTAPNIEIEYINIMGGGIYGREKLQTMIAGNDTPDMMMLNTGQFEAYAERNLFYDLGSFVEKESYDLSIYWPVAIEGCKYKGVLYGLPKDISDVILYYNKDMFDAAGIQYPTANWKFSDMLEAAEKLTIKNEDGSIKQWGYALYNNVWAWAGHILASGGEIFDENHTKVLLNNPRSVNALDEYFNKLNKFAPPPGAIADMGWAGAYILNRTAAMGLFGPWFRPQLAVMETPFRWGIAHYPVADITGKQATVAYVDMWGIYRNSKVAEPAWNFMKYLSSKAGQELWVKFIGARSISPVIEVASSPEWINFGSPSSGSVILDALSYARVPPINFSSAMEVETIWDQAFESVIIGDETVQQAVSKILPPIQQVLDEMR